MKNKLGIISILVAVLSITYAIGQEPITSQAQWVEKDNFHKVMAQTYHPSEEGNFEPIRSRIGEMMEKATAWANSTAPKEFDKPEIKSTIKVMIGQIAELQAMIDKKATNDELKPKLEALHDTFHKVVGMCKPGESHDHDGHGHEGHGHDGHDHGGQMEKKDHQE